MTAAASFPLRHSDLAKLFDTKELPFPSVVAMVEYLGSHSVDPALMQWHHIHNVRHAFENLSYPAK